MDYRAAAKSSLGAARAKAPSPAGGRMRTNAGARSTATTTTAPAAAADGGTKRPGEGPPLSYAATAKKSGGGSGPERGDAARPLTALVGAAVELDMADGSRLDGVLYAFDVYSGVVAVVSEPEGAARGRLRVVLARAANIAAVRVAKGPSPLPELPDLPLVDPARIEARKARELVLAQERAARIGVGVSDKAQAIFEALSKTMPCRWDQDRIVVLDEVLIEPPYAAENCRELSAAAFSLTRVRKVLQGELSRLDQTAAK
ncbi:hypothetical protein H4R18_000750 [Coemansia javaensis]|uniref:AD domain-containing protein n=1 Tax=Coemansia javaensis TaxID=2761396 RepID=A0A9W8HH38_9FUNG|nr:hypothetical protein H4R18_000750 [Coemansia javaensis]